jgi:hypothetical protein
VTNFVFGILIGLFIVAGLVIAGLVLWEAGLQAMSEI